MKQKDVHKEVENAGQAPEGVLNDICDGNYIKNHSYVKNNPKSLMLAFYFDELEVANPLGSRQGKHKLGMQCRLCKYMSIKQ